MGSVNKSGGADLKLIPKYLGNLHLGVCVGPVRGVSKIVFGDRLIWAGYIPQSMTFNINDENLFGGLEREGGILGSITVLLGHDTQILPLALAKIIDPSVTKYGDYPCHRGVCSVFFGPLVKPQYSGALIADLTREDIFELRYGTAFYWRSNTRVLPPIKVEVIKYPSENEANGIIPRTNDNALSTDYRGDSNPAFIVRDLMIQRNFGAGIAQPHFNEASFREAAATLATEGLGMTYPILQNTEIDNLINDILKHIDAMCYEDSRTGQMHMRLLRNEPLIRAEAIKKENIAGPHNSEVTAFKIQNEELINQLDITYTRDVLFKDERVQIGKDKHDLPIYRYVKKTDTNRNDSVTVQDIAGMTSDSGVIAESRSYLGIRSPRMAQKVAERDLIAAAYPLAYMEIDLFNDFAHLSPGDILAVNSPEDTPDEPDRLFIMRVMNITESLDGGKYLKANLAEDVYSRSEPPVYAVPVGEEDVDNTPPTNDYDVLPITLPYILEVRAGIYEEGFVHFGMLVSTDQAGVNDFLLTAEGVSLLDNPIADDNLGNGRIVARGALIHPLPAMSNNVVDAAEPASISTIPRYYEVIDNPGTDEAVTRLVDILAVSNPGEVTADSIIMIFNEHGLIDEMVGIKEIDDENNTITLWRGLFDTIPRNWNAGTEFVVLPESALFFDRTLRLGGGEKAERISYKIYPTNAGGILTEEDAEIARQLRKNPPDGVPAQDPYVLSDRPHRPYPPANIMLGGRVTQYPAYNNNGIQTKKLLVEPTNHTTETNADGTPLVIPRAQFDGYLRDPAAQEPLLITWDNRNRVTETAVAHRWQQGNVMPEKDQRTQIELWRFDESATPPVDVFVKAYHAAPQRKPGTPVGNPFDPMFYPRYFEIPLADMLDSDGNVYEEMLIRTCSVLIDPESVPNTSTGLQSVLFTSLYSHDIRVTLDNVTGWGAYWNQPWGV